MPIPRQKIQFQLYGRASQKVVLHDQFSLTPKMNQSLLAHLAQRGIQLASSCSGQGICHKCAAWYRGKKILACQNTWHSLIAIPEGKNEDHPVILEVDYL